MLTFSGLLHRHRYWSGYLQCVVHNSCLQVEQLPCSVIVHTAPQVHKLPPSAKSNVLAEQSWYHATADRKKAEAMLKTIQKVCCLNLAFTIWRQYLCQWKFRCGIEKRLTFYGNTFPCILALFVKFSHAAIWNM